MAKSTTDRVLLGLMIVLVIGLVVVISDLFEQRVVEAGDRAPGFSVTTENGRKISTTDFGGKLLVVNFWATWCPPCVEEMPSLNEFARQMKPQSVVVLGISVDRNEQAYKRFIAGLDPAFLSARDPDAGIPAQYGTFKWPETYVIDPSGRVRQKYVGPRNWTDTTIVNEIRGLL